MTKMTPERWRRLESLFEAVRGLSDDQRLAVLEEQCTDDPSLIGEVEVLIRRANDADAAGFLGEPCPMPAGADDEARWETEGFAQTLNEARRAPRITGFDGLLEIGRGGMGVVYRARQQNPVRTVALKVVLHGHFASAEAYRRFHDEAEAAGRLDHPGIVPVYEAGELDGIPYFTMPLIEGRNLTVIINGRPLPAQTAAKLLVQIADAVQHAHERDVFHRDIKPSNILVTPDGQPRVTDFGIAKGWKDDAPHTASGRLLGTPGYMAPEQARASSDTANAQVDVYALGAVLYDCTTGRAPFTGSGVTDIVRQVLDNEPVPPRQLNPGLERDLETICLKCLDKDPRRRYASARELADDLRRFLRGDAILARGPGLAYRIGKAIRKNLGLLSAVAAILILLVAGIIGTSIGMVRAIRSERQGQVRLREALLNSARATRWSGRPGRRFDTLQMLEQAAAITPLPPEIELAIRNETIAAMALRDVRIWKT